MSKLKFGNWSVLYGPCQNNLNWLCVCDCGTQKEVNIQNLKRGLSVSCGCYRALITKSRSTKHNHQRRGQTTPTYHSWASMIQRCTNVKFPSYQFYGAKGITVDHSWREFQSFLFDMGERPMGTTLDRIDNTKGYFPGNCKWSTPKQQANNTKRNKLIEFNGEIRTLADWSDLTGLSRSTISQRLKTGWSVEDALNLKVRERTRWNS